MPDACVDKCDNAKPGRPRTVSAQCRSSVDAVQRHGMLVSLGAFASSTTKISISAAVVRPPVSLRSH